MKTPFKFSLSAMVLAVAGIVATAPMQSALAFDYGYRADNYFYTWQLDQAFNRSLEQSEELYKELYGDAKPSKKSSKSSSKKSSSAKTSSTSKSTTKAPDYSSAHRYTHSNSVSSQINSQMIDLLRQDLQSKGQLNSQTQAELDKLSKANLSGKVRNALKSDGYDPNSIATAMAYWIVVNYGIATRSDLASLKGHGLVDQLKTSLSNEEIAKMSAAEKQKMAEKLYWMGSLQMAMYFEAVKQNNQNAINTRIKDAKSALSNAGVSISNLKQGSRGLELK